MISEFRIIVGDSHQSKYERGGSMYQLFCRFLIFQVGLFVSYEQLLGGESPPGFGTGEWQRNQYPLPHGGEPENLIKVDRRHLSKSSKKCSLERITYPLPVGGIFEVDDFPNFLPRERWDMDSFCGRVTPHLSGLGLMEYHPTIPTIQHLWKVPTPPAMLPSNSISSVG